ncbi:hypothetical protein [Sphingomonas turrisvirgatae]|uniref:Uncharacterized protein n=1 Tax=Sphingomonas turrisvirgatae TaxID=1888892 RepID=A0A1E3LZU5_9SPHN|nr:hypothetical protein [Sphingomonas turrisvirgatae]ODP39259.1 hypothetical protein BFL28_10625 [Sphingomonas turrisvirgatae]
MAKETAVNSHRASQRGYANGLLIEEGEYVPAGVPVSETWMEKVGKDDPLQRAVEEALDPQPGDVDLTRLSKAALEAKATEHGINPAGLSKDDLITAIKAAYDKDRTQ